MRDIDKKKLNYAGWDIECESPFEIRHRENGAFATLQAADLVLESLDSLPDHTDLIGGWVNGFIYSRHLDDGGLDFHSIEIRVTDCSESLWVIPTECLSLERHPFYRPPTHTNGIYTFENIPLFDPPPKPKRKR